MKYDKQPIDLARQIMLLKERGMAFQDEDAALRILSSISYFRIANYWRHMERRGSNRFLCGSNFDSVVELYGFDRELRSIVFSAIQDVEVAFRARLGHALSLKYGAFWFADASLFKDKSIHKGCLEKLSEEARRTHEEYIREHFLKYDESPFPPSWKILEVASFGTLSKLYGNLSDIDVKKEVSRSFGLPSYPFFENWMKCAAVLRNCCAHHARLWNRRFSVIPKYPRHLPNPWIIRPLTRPEKIYGQLCCLAYLEQSIYPNSGFGGKLKQLMSRSPMVDVKAMGFAEGWASEPLWTQPG